MSKSYKKYPIVRQEKEDYRYLNRQLRHDKLAEFPKGGSYRRHKPHWNAWTYRWTKEQAIQQYQKDKLGWIKRDFPTLDTWLNYWKSCCIRK